MPTVALIAEYNPFHRGHAAQLREIREKLGERCPIVLALSSSFCQRGSIALLSSRRRAEAAVKGGADLVLRLPLAFSLADGESFARGGVRLLAGSGIVDLLAAGSEIPDKDSLKRCAACLSPETPELKEKIREGIRSGLSPHAARGCALREITGDESAARCLDQANSRLCVEYLKQLEELPTGVSKPGFFMLWRNPTASPGDISAEKIRGLIEAQGLRAGQDFFPKEALLDQLLSLMPADSLSLLLSEARQGRLLSDEDWLPLAVFLLQRAGKSEKLTPLRYMENGLADYLLKKLGEKEPQDIQIESLKSRNFSAARIRRALLSLVLDIRRDEAERLGQSPAFLQVLAYSRRGRSLLKRMKAQASLPLLGTFSDSRRSQDPSLLWQTELERRAEALRQWLCQDSVNELLLAPGEIR